MTFRHAALVVVLLAVTGAVACADSVVVDTGRKTSELTVYSDTGAICRFGIYLSRTEVYGAWAPVGWTVTIAPIGSYVSVVWTADTADDDILPGESLSGFGVDVRKRARGTWATWYADASPGYEGQTGAILIRK